MCIDMMKRYIFSLTLLAGGVAASQAAVLQVSPGSLASQLTDEVKRESSLTLTGQMDLRDFTALTENMPDLKSLDLSGVSITPYTLARVPAAGAVSNRADQLPQGALLGLHLTELTLPAGLREIGDDALAGGRFTSIALPATLTAIGDNALYGCTGLETIKLPAGLTKLGTYALGGCTSLREADLSACTLADLPVRLFQGDAALADVKLPSTLKSVGEGAFAGTTALKTVALPASVTSLGKNAFNASGLESVTIPASVTVVGDFAFSNCHSLTSAVLGNPKAELGRGIFYSDPEFVLLEAPGIEVFPDYLFASSPKTEVQPLLGDVTDLGAYSLYGNAEQTLVFGSSLVYLGDGAMENMTSLTEIDASALDAAVPELGNAVFAGIDQPKVNLVVADDASAPWKEAAQWKEFKVLEVKQTGSDDVIDFPGTQLHGRFEGTLLRLACGEPMERVEVYSASGAKAAELTPRATEAEVQAADFTERVYIVRATLQSGRVATLKLMR